MTKICQLLSAWPAGVVGVQPWLDKKQIYRQLSHHYATHGWLTKIGSGAYVRAGEKATWQGGVYAMQQGLNLAIHVGGLSSLELFGQAHFIPMGEHTKVYIFAHSQHVPRYLPKWFSNLNNVPCEYLSAQLFKTDIGLRTYNYGNFSIQVSTIERAIFEVLSLVSSKTSMEHACLLMEYQNSLRTELVQKLLQECNSQVLKRLFIYFARKFNLSCLPALDLKKVDLGRGERRIGDGEVFVAELKLFVPKISQEVDPDQEVPDV
jgi:hypothetical protein